VGQEALELNLATTLLVEAAIAPTHHIHDLVMAHLRAPARTSIIIAVRLVGEEASLGKMFHVLKYDSTCLVMLHYYDLGTGGKC